LALPLNVEIRVIRVLPHVSWTPIPVFVPDNKSNYDFMRSPRKGIELTRCVVIRVSDIKSV